MRKHEESMGTPSQTPNSYQEPIPTSIPIPTLIKEPIFTLLML